MFTSEFQIDPEFMDRIVDRDVFSNIADAFRTIDIPNLQWTFDGDGWSSEVVVRTFMGLPVPGVFYITQK